jgi:DNA-binding transcriptional MerR regulator
MEEWADLWKIGQVADALGTTARTLRFYEEQGLLTPRRTPRGTRLYTAHDWERAKVVLDLTELGIPLEEISAVVRARPDSATGAQASRAVSRHLHHLKHQAEAIRDRVETLLADVAAAETAIRACRDCPNPPTPTGCPHCPALARLEEDTLLNLIWDPEEGAGPEEKG